ncbi:hypothetical protein [Hyalangium versicolor]|uniref:hypothetical protein n=1 Tax=Hyalangium versicolor TaxID=2861190 RepID=UPI001CCDE7E7|nr:hypothetical protein [Hyalangium versicolor]
MSPLLFVPTFFLILAGCKGLPFFSHGSTRTSGGEESHRTVDGAFAHAHLEFQEASYDGENLWGRLLISPIEVELRIDKRLIESIDLTVDSVVSCETGEAIPYLILDASAPSRRDEDILTLKPGFWYGKQVRLFLFAEHATHQPSPRCFEAVVAYHAVDVKNVARVRIRAERAVPTALDAGVPHADPDRTRTIEAE